MSIIKDINSNFISRLASVSSNSRDTRALAKALNGQSSKVSISDLGQSAAGTLSKAVTNVNRVISSLNITEANLNEILENVEDMYRISKRQLPRGLTKGQIRNFQKKANRIIEILDEASDLDIDLLNKDGIATLLTSVGFDPDTSTTISDFLDQFRTVKGDSNKNTLVSQEVTKNVKVPASLQGTVSTVQSAVYERETNISASTTGNGPLFEDGIIYNATDADQSATVPHIRNDSAYTTALAPGLGANFSILGAHESSGYIIAKSTDDALGYNASNDEVLYLIDPSGNIIQQLSVATTGNTISEATISADGKTALFSYSNGGVSSADIVQISGSFGADPSSLTTSTVASGASSQSSLALSDDGSYYAFIELGKINFSDTATKTADSTITALTTNTYAVDFIDNNQIVFIDDGSSNQDVELFTYGGGSTTT
ncbi:MAG: hypothetical protein KDD56_10000, partial [Bdellovibrionales bacterium]|nr:hypothetical protein [Bdellovibrionales bacterium]